MHLKEVEINNLTADSVKSALLVAVRLPDEWIAVEMQQEAPVVDFHQRPQCDRQCDNDWWPLGPP